MKKENGRILFYSLAGAYLVYLAFNMIRDLGQVEGAEKIVMILASVVFAVFGAGLVIWGIRRGMEQMKNPPAEEEAGGALEEPGEETKALPEETETQQEEEDPGETDGTKTSEES